MAIKVSFISGKGGSGKTTLSLSLARLLSDCDIKVLLVDCDIATNGATYFFESMLQNKDEILALPAMFVNADAAPSTKPANSERVSQPASKAPLAAPILVNEFLHFIPATTSSQKELTTAQIRKGKTHFLKHISRIDSEYDVVLFDCQAGYTDLIRILAEQADHNVLVMEADSISSAATRVLFARLAGAVSKKRCFQVFNKITDTEKAVYEKVTSGTIFDALPPVSFSWNVRRAFVYRDIPDMVSVNTAFGSDIYQLAASMLPKLRDRLKVYQQKLLHNEEKELRKRIDSLTKDRDSYSLKKKQLKKRYLLQTLLPQTLFLCIVFVGLFLSIRSIEIGAPFPYPGVVMIIIEALLPFILLLFIWPHLINSRRNEEDVKLLIALEACEANITQCRNRISQIHAALDPIVKATRSKRHTS